MNRVFTLFAICLMSINVVLGQSAWQLSSESQIKINGTSTIHDWEVKSEKMAGSMLFTPKGKIKSNKLMEGKISDGKLSVNVVQIKSERGATMDGKMHQALKVEAHPTIGFVLSQPIQLEKKTRDGVEIKGQLSIAGVTKTSDVSASVSQTNAGTIVISGETALKLTDFNITPPTAMFGQIQTGDDISVVFDLIFVPGIDVN